MENGEKMRVDPPDVLIEVTSGDAGNGQSLEPGLLSEHSAIISVGSLRFAAQLRLESNLLPGIATKVPVKFADPEAALATIQVGTELTISDRGYRGHGLVLEVYSNIEDAHAPPPFVATKDFLDQSPSKEFAQSHDMGSPPEPVEVYLGKKGNYFLIVFGVLSWITCFIVYKNKTFDRPNYFYSFCFWGFTIAVIVGFYIYLKMLGPYWEGSGTPFLSFNQNSVAFRGKEIPWFSVTSIKIQYQYRRTYWAHYLTVNFKRFPYRSYRLTDEFGRDSTLSLNIDDLTLSVDQIASVVQRYASWIKLDPDKVLLDEKIGWPYKNN